MILGFRISRILGIQGIQDSRDSGILGISGSQGFLRILGIEVSQDCRYLRIFSRIEALQDLRMFRDSGF